MTKNQIWFDRNYSKSNELIKLTYENFQGRLVIEEYSQLEELYLRYVNSIDEIIFRNLSQLKECTIWNCGLTNLIIENCPRIKKLNLRGNLLTNLDFLESLEKSRELNLDLSFNNFSNSEPNSNLELEPFREFSNLSNLNISNSFRGKISNRYNRFSGSLMYLEDKNSLRELEISNTDIDRGLEFLPEILSEIRCSNDLLVNWIRGNGCSHIVQRLRSHWKSGNCYDLYSWRRENCINNIRLSTLRQRNTQIVELEEQLAQIQLPPKN